MKKEEVKTILTYYAAFLFGVLMEVCIVYMVFDMIRFELLKIHEIAVFVFLFRFLFREYFMGVSRDEDGVAHINHIGFVLNIGLKFLSVLLFFLLS